MGFRLAPYNIYYGSKALGPGLMKMFWSDLDCTSTRNSINYTMPSRTLADFSCISASGCSDVKTESDRHTHCFIEQPFPSCARQLIIISLTSPWYLPNRTGISNSPGPEVDHRAYVEEYVTYAYAQYCDTTANPGRLTANRS
jgi:hypothetical protein